LERRLF